MSNFRRTGGFDAIIPKRVTQKKQTLSSKKPLPPHKIPQYVQNTVVSIKDNRSTEEVRAHVPTLQSLVQEMQRIMTQMQQNERQNAAQLRQIANQLQLIVQHENQATSQLQQLSQLAFQMSQQTQAQWIRPQAQTVSGIAAQPFTGQIGQVGAFTPSVQSLFQPGGPLGQPSSFGGQPAVGQPQVGGSPVFGPAYTPTGSVSAYLAQQIDNASVEGSS